MRFDVIALIEVAITATAYKGLVVYFIRVMIRTKDSAFP
jgi:hypothetical protein